MSLSYPPFHCVAVKCPPESYRTLCFQEPCIEEHCHDSWFPGTNLLSNLHHVINFVRVRVPETAPEVKREAPPSTSTEASSYGQVKKKKKKELHCCNLDFLATPVTEKWLDVKPPVTRLTPSLFPYFLPAPNRNIGVFLSFRGQWTCTILIGRGSHSSSQSGGIKHII